MHGLGISEPQGPLPTIAACFGCCTDSAILLADAMIEKPYSHGANIALRGDPSTAFHLVLDGIVVAEIFGIDGQQAQLTRHGPGEIFGAYPVPTEYRADFRAATDCRLLSIPTQRLETLAMAHADIGAGIAGLLARQLDRMLDRMAARIGLSASGRFHKALLQLADDTPSAGYFGASAQCAYHARNGITRANRVAAPRHRRAPSGSFAHRVAANAGGVGGLGCVHWHMCQFFDRLHQQRHIAIARQAVIAIFDKGYAHIGRLQRRCQFQGKLPWHVGIGMPMQQPYWASQPNGSVQQFVANAIVIQ